MSDLLSKAAGCLAGVALGDALGRATEFMTPDQIRTRWGRLDHFDLPMDGHPAHGDPLGTITDDTEQTLLIARVLAASDGPLTPERVAAAMIEWGKQGLSRYLGPSTRKAIERLMQGESPLETGKGGTTNGAAMRVAAIGIAHAGDLDAAFKDAIAASIPTHNTHNAIQGATAVACSIAAAMKDQASVEDVLTAARDAAQAGRRWGGWSWATPLDKRIELAVRLVTDAPNLESALQSLYDFVGVGMDPAESVAAAFGVVAAVEG
ncbi:MAG TPA: ADP-ribosylglycohydrolase family protein, partial [Anaerolineae bacterium]